MGSRKFPGCIADRTMLPDLSLRGGAADVAISQYPAGSQESHGENVTGCERLPRPLRGLAMTRQGGAAVHQSPHAVKLPPTRRSLSAATDAIGLYGLSLPCTSRKCLPEIATGAKRPRNDTSGSAKVHQRPCTVELPRTGRSAGLSPQLIGLKILKYCAAVGGFAALRMRHAPCGYTKYSCNFQTSIWNKIPR